MKHFIYIIVAVAFVAMFSTDVASGTALLKTESTEQEDGSILRILRKGYVMNDEVIRPTQVEIAENIKNKNDDKENKDA